LTEGTYCEQQGNITEIWTDAEGTVHISVMPFIG